MPLKPPPNPKAEQARAEIVAYNAPLVQNPMYDGAPPAPPLSVALEQVGDRLNSTGQWHSARAPLTLDLATALVEKMHHAGGWCWGVTVRVKG